MTRLRALLAASVLAAGCMKPAPYMQVDIPYDDAQAAKSRALLADGPNAIHGSALLRQQGGGVVTCAGNRVWLIPATEYAQKRMMLIYGSSQGGYTPVTTRNRVAAADPTYSELTRQSTCDAQGFFTFKKLTDGDFYVYTEVLWSVGKKPQGGGLARLVSVRGGGTEEVVLAQ